MIDFLIDAIVYLVLAGAAFWFVAWLWRRIFGEVSGRLERFLFWGTWAGASLLLAGAYHVATGDRDFGRAVMLLALAEALLVLIGVNVGAAAMFRKPYVPEDDPEFMAEMEERRRLREEGFQRYLAEMRGGRVLPTERRQLR